MGAEESDDLLAYRGEWALEESEVWPGMKVGVVYLVFNIYSG